MNELMKALQKKYESDIAVAKANIEVYLKNPAGIGEHPDIVEAVNSQVQHIADADDKLEVLLNHYTSELGNR